MTWRHSLEVSGLWRLTRSPRGLLHLPRLKDVPPNYDRGVSGRGAESISFTHCGEKKKSQETVLEGCSSLNLCGWMEAGEMSEKKRIVVDLGERLVWHFLWDFLWFVESYLWTFLSNTSRFSSSDRKLVRLIYCFTVLTWARVHFWWSSSSWAWTQFRTIVEWNRFDSQHVFMCFCLGLLKAM